MASSKKSLDVFYMDCTECLSRTEKTKKKQAQIFILSFFSLGILSPIAILIALVMQSGRFNTCTGCQEIMNEERIAKKAKLKAFEG